jgi:hypothetical protein
MPRRIPQASKALPSERDVKRLIAALRYDADELLPVIKKLQDQDDPASIHRVHTALCRMVDGACSLEMLSKLIPARGPFDG